MSPTSLRARLLLIAAPAVHGCSSSAPTPETPPATTPVVVATVSAGPARSTDVPHAPLRPTASASAAAPAISAASWKVGNAVCVTSSRTEGTSAGMGCGELTAEAIKAIRGEPGACGYCYYAFSELATQQTMSEHRDGCCYDERHPSRGRPFVVEASEREAPLVRGLVGWSA